MIFTSNTNNTLRSVHSPKNVCWSCGWLFNSYNLLRTIAQLQYSGRFVSIPGIGCWLFLLIIICQWQKPVDHLSSCLSYRTSPSMFKRDPWIDSGNVPNMYKWILLMNGLNFMFKFNHAIYLRVKVLYVNSAPATTNVNQFVCVWQPCLKMNAAWWLYPQKYLLSTLRWRRTKRHCRLSPLNYWGVLVVLIQPWKRLTFTRQLVTEKHTVFMDATSK